MGKTNFIHYLISIFISIYIHHSCLIHGQSQGGVDEPTPAPNTPAPTTEFPKRISFTMQLFMADARFGDFYTNAGRQYTLGALFRRVLCVYIFGFPSHQCGRPLDDNYRLTIVSPSPTQSPTTEPTYDPTIDPTTDPTTNPTLSPTDPTMEPTINPTTDPTLNPTIHPTSPTELPTTDPTLNPTLQPSLSPTKNPTESPTETPTADTTAPTTNPSVNPTFDPSSSPTSVTGGPTSDPTMEPTKTPTDAPSADPTKAPSKTPSATPSTTPTFDPTVEPTVDPTSDPTLEPTMDPTDTPSTNPTVEPTWEPTSDPTMEPTTPTAAPMTRRRRLLSEEEDMLDILRRVLASNDTTMEPSPSPTTAMPSQSPTALTIFDLNIRFYVNVTSKAESDKVYNTIKSIYFFNEFKQALLDALQYDSYVLEHYENVSRKALRGQIESMQQAPFSDIGILSPTHSPTMYPTYDYEAGEDYGYWMIGLGICIIVAVVAYWGYTKYSKHQDYKEEQKSAPPSQELQTLFDDSYKE